MTAIEQKISELCPKGVEYQPLEECCNILDRFRRPVTKAARETGEYPYYGANGIQDYVSDYIFDGTFVLVGEDGSVITPNGSPVVNWANGKIWVNNHAHIIEEKGGVLLRYLFHYLQTLDIAHLIHGNIPKLTGKDFKALLVPVPPLEVQGEIVHILDNFMELTAELTTRLTAELSARKKQYEYYRDEMLKPQNDIPMVTLQEIATDIFRGSGIKRDQVTEDGIPCVRYGEIYTTYNTWFDECISHTRLEYVPSPKYFEHGDILFAITGENVEDIAKSVAYIGHEKCLAGGDIVVLKHNQNPRYLAHVLATQAAREQKSRGKVKSKVVHSSVPSIEQIIIPLPSLDVQERYADVLDNFETICNSLQIGLPAEIEARKKQYEYYRDMLLTFMETGGTILTENREQRTENREQRTENREQRTENREQRTYDLCALIRLCQYVFGYALVPMADLFDFRNGLSKGKEFFGRGTPFIRYTDVYNNRFLKAENISAKVECTPAELENLHVSRGDVLFTRTSETAEDVGWSSVMLDDIGDCVFNGFTIKASPKTNQLLPEYCAYCFSTKEFRQYVTSHCAFTTRASLTGKTLSEYLLPVPSLEKQQKIADRLGKFYALCNDLSEGIPAEIAARQKQYEYYRDKLLTFQPMEG